ncbi:MAG: glycosyltransferase family 4 protein [Alphaproteobacteria bacterium]|nr:glycosyltransferase family 4 protein [Alphaproteobacteria bacterium]
MRILTFTTLFPNFEQPSHGIFVENRLRHLLGSGALTAKVVAPVPWFPSRSEAFGAYARLARMPRQEMRHGISVLHPRYISIPKIGMHLAPFLLYLGARRAIKRMIAQGDAFDLIDAHYFYPDGIAAALLGREMGRPLVITARGTDINLIAEYPLPRRMILWAVKQAQGVITVCEALKTRLVELGAEPGRIHVLRNGVDLDGFRPCARDMVRREHDIGTEAPLLLSVGHLIERKAHHLAIEALALLPEARLLIAGEGPERAALETLAVNRNVAGRVRFLGRVPHERLPEIYSAADVLILASSREGWANVLLESMACGTPVVASDVWGTPEVVADPAAGILVKERTGSGFADAIKRLLSAPPRREATRRYAERFSWNATTEGQLALFRRILEMRSATPS